jgi:hypothetical protein
MFDDWTGAALNKLLETLTDADAASLQQHLDDARIGAASMGLEEKESGSKPVFIPSTIVGNDAWEEECRGDVESKRRRPAHKWILIRTVRRVARNLVEKLERHDRGYGGVVWCGVVWCGVVWCGVV